MASQNAAIQRQISIVRRRTSAGGKSGADSTWASSAAVFSRRPLRSRTSWASPRARPGAHTAQGKSPARTPKSRLAQSAHANATTSSALNAVAPSSRHAGVSAAAITGASAGARAPPLAATTEQRHEESAQDEGDQDQHPGPD